MNSAAIANGYRDLAEAVIKWAIEDLRLGHAGASHQDRFYACMFLLDEHQMDIYTGLAPHMILDWERAIPQAREIMVREYRKRTTEND